MFRERRPMYNILIVKRPIVSQNRSLNYLPLRVLVLSLSLSTNFPASAILISSAGPEKIKPYLRRSTGLPLHPNFSRVVVFSSLSPYDELCK